MKLIVSNYSESIRFKAKRGAYIAKYELTYTVIMKEGSVCVESSVEFTCIL